MQTSPNAKPGVRNVLNNISKFVKSIFFKLNLGKKR